MNLTRLCNHVTLFVLAVSSLSSLVSAAASRSPFCKSSVCQEKGTKIINSIDNAIDPCTDFYQHACGRWENEHPVPKSALTVNQYSVMADRVALNVKELLENVDGDDTEAIQKAKEYYKVCVDTDAIERTGLKPLMDFVARNGDWPMFVPRSQWSIQNLTWLQIHENIAQSSGMSALFDVELNVDPNNAIAYVLTVSTPYKAIPMNGSRESLILSDARKKFRLGIIQEISYERSSNVPFDDIKADFAETIEFDDKLVEASQVDTHSDDDSEMYYRTTTINKLQDMWDAVVNDTTEYKVDWLEIIKSRFEGSNIVIDKNETVLLQPADYLPRLASLLLETPIRTIVNLIQYEVVDVYLESGLFNGTRELQLEFFQKIGVQEIEERWRKCINAHPMPNALAMMYVKKHFTDQTRASVQELVSFIRDAAYEKIDRSSWMDEDSKTSAKEKLNAMKYEIGYPEWYDEQGNVDNYYRKLIFGPNELENRFAAGRFKAKNEIHKLREPVEQFSTGLYMSAIDSNAAFDPDRNGIFLPAAILQLPIFHHEQLASVNFGTLGAIIGHEISHGFDLDGHLRDKNGNLGQWWSNSTTDAYEKKAECFIEQYNKYELTKDSTTNQTIYIDGVRTANENIADNSGNEIAYLALQRYISSYRRQTNKIPMLQHYSKEKLFFYGMANSKCESSTQEFLEYFAIHNSYPVNKVRLNAGVSNMKEFADAFQCPPGSPMNPTDKCVLWD